MLNISTFSIFVFKGNWMDINKVQSKSTLLNFLHIIHKYIIHILYIA